MSAFENKIDAVRKAYASGLYEPALALALTFHDICAQIEYPNVDKVGDRYIKWSNNHIFQDNPSNDKETFSGAALYQLRCHFLHTGNSDLYKDNGSIDSRVYISKFELMLPKSESDNSTELMIRAMTWKDDQTNKEFYTVQMNIREIIDAVCNATQEFYEDWPNKNDFVDHSIQLLCYTEDLDEQVI